MNNLFSDNMVLQRNSSVNIWGKSNPSQIVTVYSSWNNKSVKTKSNSSGEWKLKIKTDNSVGPYELTISTKNETKVIELLDDISKDLFNYDLELRIQELESKFSKDLSETTFNELKELKNERKTN